MATTQTKQSKSRQAVMYPLDWHEERSGLVGGVKYFLFRKVPGDSGWWHTLGSATLTAFLVQLVTGVILAMYYKPDPQNAHASVEHITNDLWGGWLVRGMHRWGASVFIILMFMHPEEDSLHQQDQEESAGAEEHGPWEVIAPEGFVGITQHVYEAGPEEYPAGKDVPQREEQSAPF